MRTSARMIITLARGPEPRIIGKGPIKITVPTLPTFLPLIMAPNMGARDIRRIPTKIITNAKKNNQAVGTRVVVRMIGEGCFMQPTHHHRFVSKQS